MLFSPPTPTPVPEMEAISFNPLKRVYAFLTVMARIKTMEEMLVSIP